MRFYFTVNSCGQIGHHRKEKRTDESGKQEKKKEEAGAPTEFLFPAFLLS
jgi:hypothetical protein